MRELLAEGLELLAYLLVTAILAVAGVFAEVSSLSYMSEGNTTFALWLALMGVVALYAAFTMGTDKLLPRLRDRSA